MRRFVPFMLTMSIFLAANCDSMAAPAKGAAKKAAAQQNMQWAMD